MFGGCGEDHVSRVEPTGRASIRHGQTPHAGGEARARGARAGDEGRRKVAAGIRAELGIGDDLAKAFLAGTEWPDALRRPNAKDELCQEAIELRRQGATYGQSAAALSVSKSTCSLWLRDLPRGVPLEQFRRSTIKRHHPKTVRKNSGDSCRGCLSITVLQRRVLYEVMHGLVQGLALQPRTIEEWHDGVEAPVGLQAGADLPSALV